MKCPECLEEVVEGDLHCPYCGATLEEEIDCEMEEDKGFTHLLSVSDESEAFAIKELLETNGIPVLIRSQGNNKEKDSLDYSSDTWGEVLVNRVDLNNSLSIVQKFMDTQRELLIQEDDRDDERDDEREDDRIDGEEPL